jgi:hypothetical protein
VKNGGGESNPPLGFSETQGAVALLSGMRALAEWKAMLTLEESPRRPKWATLRLKKRIRYLHANSRMLVLTL